MFCYITYVGQIELGYIWIGDVLRFDSRTDNKLRLMQAREYQITISLNYADFNLT